MAIWLVNYACANSYHNIYVKRSRLLLLKWFMINVNHMLSYSDVSLSSFVCNSISCILPVFYIVSRLWTVFTLCNRVCTYPGVSLLVYTCITHSRQCCNLYILFFFNLLFLFLLLFYVCLLSCSRIGKVATASTTCSLNVSACSEWRLHSAAYSPRMKWTETYEIRYDLSDPAAVSKLR